MLRAIHNNNYRQQKTGNIIMVFKVTGTVDEINDYLNVTAARRGRTIEDLPRSEDKDKAPLFQMNFTQMDRNGETAQGVYNLIKNHAGDRYFADTTGDLIRKQAEEAEDVRKAKAQIKAELQLGLRVAPRNGAQAPRINTAIAEPTTTAAEEMIAEITNAGAKVVEVAAGNEDLVD